MEKIEVRINDRMGMNFSEEDLSLEELTVLLKKAHEKYGIYMVAIGLDVEGEFEI